MHDRFDKATFGLGCFWCSEASFSGLKGVVSTHVGYMGGTGEDPTYESVCLGENGFIEVVEVEHDPSLISYQQLLEVFWSSHNPVVMKDGNGDYGAQYRSAIFFHSEEQRVIAECSRRRIQASGRFRGPISTIVIAASRFWLAEVHHQCYIAKLRSHEKTIDGCGPVP
jgi:peptide-methionine (S)-S-oxide reductase